MIPTQQPRHMKMTAEQQKRADELLRWVKRNKTQKQLNLETGISPSTIYGWFSCCNRPTIPGIQKLEKHYGQYVK